MSFINFNLELARPECSVDWDASSKMTMILVSPLALASLIGFYGLSKIIFHKKNEVTGSHDLKVKMESMAVGMFVVCSSFFLKGILGGFDCTENPNGRSYLDIQPDIECDNDRGIDADGFRIYESINFQARLGMGVYLVLFLSFLRFFLSGKMVMLSRFACCPSR